MIDKSEFHRYIYARWFSIGVDRFTHKRCGYSRSRRQGHVFRLPISGRWRLNFETAGRSYLQLVGAPEYLRNTDWVIDEFDSSFNDLAIASLRYHLDFSICANSRNREKYEDIIARLSESRPEFTDEERAILYPDGWTFEDEFEDKDGRLIMKQSTPEQSAVYRTYDQRELEWIERVDRARHDFVDIMRGLWS